MKKLMNLRGATILKVALQKEIQGGGNPPITTLSNCTAVAEIAPCQNDNECPAGQICCLGNCGTLL